MALELLGRNLFWFLKAKVISVGLPKKKDDVMFQLYRTITLKIYFCTFPINSTQYSFTSKNLMADI